MLKNVSAVVATAFLLGACSSEPPPPPPMVATTTTAPQSQNFMVFFDWDSSRLTDTSMNVIHQASAAYKSRGTASITATGNTDTSGPDGYNMALSLRRANVVKDALVRDGVPASAITVIGRGETVLLVQTGDGVREPQNRRVEISFGTTGTTTTVAFPLRLSYCREMARLYRTNVANSNADARAGQALAQCEAGETDRGIPTLEMLLTDAKVPLPRRGY
jgi:hypothetical protein